MADELSGPAPIPTASGTTFIATFAVMVAVIAGLLFFDLFLARLERRESAAHAASLYAEGISFLGQHRAGDAEDRFAMAASIDRSNTSYALALAEARLEEGQTAEARATLHDLLERAGNDGAVNLVMARVLLRSNRTEEAKAYYHRAIFGRWGADSVSRRQEARFELIDLLAGNGSGPELLAELLPFEDVSSDSIALRLRLARLFIVAGSPARAVTAFRGVLRRDPQNADAYSGIGDAELALGNFRAARADFSEAFRLRPRDPTFERQLSLVDSVFALDPTVRGIGAAKRLSRARALLERTLSALLLCGQSGTPLLTARTLLGAATEDDRLEALTDSIAETATSLWSARPPTCNITDKALRLAQARLAQ